MTKKSILIAALGLFSLNITTQDTPKREGLVFATVKESPTTPIKSQNRFSTCWSLSGLGFLESGLLRMGKGEYDLSEIFVVHHTVVDRVQNYVRYHGDSSFSPGGSFYDIMFCLKNYGLVPQEAIPGIAHGGMLPIHSELDAVAGTYTNVIAKGKLTRLSPVQKNGLSAIYDTYLDRCPEKLIYKGEEYTPEALGESLGINPNNYMPLISCIHYPFYAQPAIEIQDNWRNGLSWNLPIDELVAVMNGIIKEGYAFAWESDVGKQGFTRDDIAVVPDAARGAELIGSDMARWTGLIAADKHKEPTSKPLPEVSVTQEIRQAAFDNWKTADGHGMVIYGIIKDQDGKEHFMIKDSWELSGKYKGIWYASKVFVAYKIMGILVHKNALPKDITKKLEFKQEVKVIY